MYRYRFKVIPVNWLHSGINQPNNKEAEEWDVKRVLLLQASMEKQKKNKKVKNIHETVTVVGYEIKIRWKFAKRIKLKGGKKMVGLNNWRSWKVEGLMEDIRMMPGEENESNLKTTEGS